MEAIHADQVVDALSAHAKRLASMRTRLLAFDYPEQVGPESLDLVERLFGDLVSTTEVYQQLHEREEQLSQVTNRSALVYIYT